MNYTQTKEKLRELLIEQKELLKATPKNQHAYYIEQFQDELVDLLNPSLQYDDCYPSQFYITLDSLEHIDVLIEDLMVYYSYGRKHLFLELLSGKIIVPKKSKRPFGEIYVSESCKFIHYYSYGSSATKLTFENFEWIVKHIFKLEFEDFEVVECDSI